MEVLKIKIYQPQAHYRLPYTYQRRHTYPIPPYSTVIGLLCNVLGIRNYNGQREPDYYKLKNIKISISGNFESKTTEYTWFRNLLEDSHNSRFGSPKNRYIAGHIEHIGGQMPVSIDILNDVRLWIYLFHSNENFLKGIKEHFEKPNNRVSVLHLGRAEDWIVIEDLKFVKLIECNIGGNFERFFWIPENLYMQDSEQRKSWKGIFQNVGGLAYMLPTFYRLQNGIRNFEYVKVKLNNGEISLCKSSMKLPFDEEEDIPVFLADLQVGGKNNGGNMG